MRPIPLLLGVLLPLGAGIATACPAVAEPIEPCGLQVVMWWVYDDALCTVHDVFHNAFCAVTDLASGCVLVLGA